MHFLWKYLELNYWNAFHNLYRQNIAKPFQSGVVPIVATREMRAREKKKQENENELNAENEKKKLARMGNERMSWRDS